MFQFPRFPLPALCVQAGVTLHDECRVSPFGHPRIDGWSAPTRGFSQPPTSFIGSCRQGIRRWPFVAWDFTHKDARARYEILKDQDRQTCRKERSHPKRGERAFTTEERTGAGLARHECRARVIRCRRVRQLGVQVLNSLVAASDGMDSLERR